MRAAASPALAPKPALVRMGLDPETVTADAPTEEACIEDEAIEVVAAMKIASDHEFFYDPGTYRCTPVLSLDGESHTAPV